MEPFQVGDLVGIFPHLQNEYYPRQFEIGATGRITYRHETVGSVYGVRLESTGNIVAVDYDELVLIFREADFSWKYEIINDWKEFGNELFGRKLWNLLLFVNLRGKLAFVL